jgi:hypothetical protein
VDVAWNRRAISIYANAAQAGERAETAPRRGRRSPMRKNVARRVQFGTALVQSMDGITSQWTESPLHSGLVERLPATLEKRSPINLSERSVWARSPTSQQNG